MDGLSHRTNTDDLEALFEKYGRIGDVYIPKVSLGRGFYICTMKMLLNRRIAVPICGNFGNDSSPSLCGDNTKPFTRCIALGVHASIELS